jgi:hypothetical protein
MRRRLPLALLSVVALALPGAAFAQTVTIDVTSITTLTQPHDTPPKGKVNKGDSLEFKDLLVNRKAQLGVAKGKPVAYDAGIITYAGKNRQTVYGVATFPGVGTVTYRGVMTPGAHGNVVVRVVSGTGGFKGAHGTLTIGPGDTKARNTYHVVVPNGHLEVPQPVGGNVA